MSKCGRCPIGTDSRSVGKVEERWKERWKISAGVIMCMMCAHQSGFRERFTPDFAKSGRRDPAVGLNGGHPEKKAISK